jgi:hypothetical protein
LKAGWTRSHDPDATIAKNGSQTAIEEPGRSEIDPYTRAVFGNLPRVLGYHDLPASLYPVGWRSRPAEKFDFQTGIMLGREVIS